MKKVKNLALGLIAVFAVLPAYGAVEVEVTEDKARLDGKIPEVCDKAMVGSSSCHGNVGDNGNVGESAQVYGVEPLPYNKYTLTIHNSTDNNVYHRISIYYTMPWLSIKGSILRTCHGDNCDNAWPLIDGSWQGLVDQEKEDLIIESISPISRITIYTFKKRRFFFDKLVSECHLGVEYKDKDCGGGVIASLTKRE